MSQIFDEIINKMVSLQPASTSETGHSIFQFEIPKNNLGNLKEHGSYYTVLSDWFNNKGHINQFLVDKFVFYSEKQEVVNELKSLIENRNKKKANANEFLMDFYKNNKKSFIDTAAKPIKTLSYDDARIFKNLGNPEKYPKVLSELDIGVCHLIQQDKLFTFRTPDQNGYKNKALKKYYNKPVATQDMLAEYAIIIDKLFAEGKIEPDVVLSGNLAKICIDNITAENKKLPNNYEYEQICILKQYAKIQGYTTNVSLKNNGHQVSMNTKSTIEGTVEIIVAKNENESLTVSYKDNENVNMTLEELVDRFYYDKNRDKVNKLVTTFKRR